MRKSYSSKFKIRMVARAIKANERKRSPVSLLRFSKDNEIPYQTLYTWVRNYRANTGG